MPAIRLRPRLPDTLGILFFSSLPVMLSLSLWRDIWNGSRSRAWDGSGHYALAQIYDQSIFPETFGWTHNYFCGMPFPNFYPPLFYWLVALVHHTHLFSFATSFKLVLSVPSLLLPAGIWLLAYRLSGRDSLAAAGAAFCCFLLVIDMRFRLNVPVGLDYYSTFVTGLYTQPLGFVLLIAWYVTYITENNKWWRAILSSVLLALTILASFFCAVTAALLILTSISVDIVAYHQASTRKSGKRIRSVLLTHLLIPVVALGLTLFWVIPMLMEYRYLVTLPQITPLRDLVPPIMWGWYVLAGVGIVRWIRRPIPEMTPFLWACAALAVGVAFGGTLAPGWFPLQSRRFLSLLNFFLVVPIGLEISSAVRSLAATLGEEVTARSSNKDQESRETKTTFPVPAPLTIVITATLLLSLLALVKLPPFSNFSFYPASSNATLESVLAFGREHRDGRYLVEFADLNQVGAGLDSRALSSYLGVQGNQNLSVVFREASPNSIFMNPIVSAFSASADNFGISSVLAEDLDFFEQPLTQHLKRAQLVGVKFLVIFSPFMKRQLLQEPNVAAEYDFGEWSIFELAGQPSPPVRILPYRPALVIANLSLKARRRDEYGFVRLVEEQLVGGSFEVTLVHSAESKIDKIQELDQFGALIVDTYEADDESLALERLQNFASSRPLILLSSETELFRRVEAKIKDFPLATIIERSHAPGDQWLQDVGPRNHYESTEIRAVWRTIQSALYQHRKPTNVGTARVYGHVAEQKIEIGIENTLEKVPVLIETTYHPNWQRDDKQPLFPATPFFMVTFLDRPTSVIYARSWLERVGLWLSGSTLAVLCFYSACQVRRRISKARGGITK